ncbi:MAG: aminopeptidase N [Proteobacteria bacterium]|nr:aminopeptidase N [Pseudomonadota bacterium]
MLPRDARTLVKRRSEYRPPAFLVPTLALTLDLDPDATRATAEFRFVRNPAASATEIRSPLMLDGEYQTAVEVELDGVRLTAPRLQFVEGGVVINDPPASGTLVVRSTSAPARNLALEGLYLSSGVFCTQCEPEGFRRITHFPDRPDVLATYTVTLRADAAKYPVLLSNGNLVAQGPLDDGRHYATWHDPFPKPTYLFAAVAGDLAHIEDRFRTMHGRDVTLAIYSTAANLPRCHHAMASLKRAMAWDEQRFGREYDLDRFMIFCADDFNMGAMENKGLNIFNSRLVLADPETATDADYTAIESVIGHEYFHNWSGNRVTCRDWFQLSLKEGLTVFRDQEFSSDMGSRAVERIAAVDALRRFQQPEDAGPMAHPIRPDEYQEINNFYTATVYEKGAEVIRMQQTLLGVDGFRRGLDLYFDRFDGQAVTCDDFVQAMGDANGVDLAQFRRWYEQAGTPVLSVRGAYDPGTQTYALDVKQVTPPTPGQPQKKPLHLPLAVGLVAPDGRDMHVRLAGAQDAPATTVVLHVRDAEQRFVLEGVTSRPVPSLGRGYSAPVKLEFDYMPDELALLAAHDSDPVNRWDAVQRAFANAMLALARDAREGRPLALPDAVATIVGHRLADADTDPALAALALTLPEAAYVAAFEPVIDVDGVMAARRFLGAALARRWRPELEALYARLAPDAPYAPVPAQMGRRHLRNVVLQYLATLDDAAARALAVAQFDAADNMTASLGALAALAHGESAERTALFARFEARWQDEPLVLDKWFRLEATSDRPGTLARVKALVTHPRFNARNPNRVRSLVGAFAMQNFARFHAADGSGYAMLADQILTLDAMNPQLASRLAGAFELWKRFPQPRRGLMQAALQRLAAAPSLSPDVSEIVTRSLAD